MSNTNNTSISLNEHLSALLDDEAGTFEQRRILDELAVSESGADTNINNELRQKLATYSLIGESMRNAGSADATVITNESFLSGIHEKLETESEYHQVQLKDVKPSAANNPSFFAKGLRPIGGFALAASVAAVAVIGFQNYQQTSPSQAPVIASVITPVTPAKIEKTQLSVAAMKSATVVSAAELVNEAEEKVVALAQTNDQYRQADARTRSLLKRYVDSHMQFASSTTFVPSVRVIAYSDY